jgi:flavin-dependent dehydrogenase
VDSISRPGAAAAGCDVLVIGGGPAGSTAATLLAERGLHVVLVEKGAHPRFHIGESLLPANLPLLERLGVRAEIEAIGLHKWAAEFVSPEHGESARYEFAEALDKSMPFAYQVRRSEFDEILFRRAARAGAETRENCRVREVDLGDRQRLPLVRATGGDGAELEWRPRFVIDASGRDTLIANRLGIKRRNPRHASAAMYAHFRGARRHEGRHEGNITIYWFEHGWFWFIPLKDGATSVGAVAWPYYMKSRSKPLPDFFRDTLAMCAPLAERLAGAEIVSEVEATGNYSYLSDACQGENHILVGDAFAFIDPVFSSGVWLAMNSAVAGAELVEARLREPAKEAARRREFERVMRHGPTQFSWFIYRVTNPAMRELFLRPSNELRIKEGLLSVLAGDIFGRTPLARPLALFKLIYYAFSLANLRRTLAASRRRASNIRDDAAIPQRAGD